MNMPSISHGPCGSMELLQSSILTFFIQIKEGLKASMKNLILDQPDLKDSLIEHSKNLFRLNNGIIQECENKNIELIKLFGLFIISSAAFFGFIKMISTK